MSKPKPDKHYQEPEQRVQPQAGYTYTPFYQRLGAADQMPSFQQPLPKNQGWFMTFWTGNQVPGVNISGAPAPSYGMYYNEQHSAQRTGGAFGGGWMNAVATFNLLERMRAAWSTQSGYNGQ